MRPSTIVFDSGLLARNPGLHTFLDHARWIASVTVVIGHARNTLMVPYAEVSDPGLLTTVIYFFSNFHFESVMVFFALSGFLVGGMALELYLSGRFDPARYFTNRFVRLYLPLIPILVLTYLVDIVIATFVVTGDEPYQAIDVSSAALHAIFLQEILIPPMAVNISLWSLTNEFWYYLLFGALLATLHARKYGQANPLPYLLLFAAALVFLVIFDKPADIGAVLLYMPMWLIGLTAWLKLPFRIPLSFSVLAFAAALLLSRSHVISDYYALRDFLIALGFMAVLASVKDHGTGTAREDERNPTFGRRLGATMASFSYSLYLIHFPIIVLVGKLLRHIFERTTPLNPSDAAAYPIVFGTIAVSIIAGFAFYWVTERFTGALRTRLYRLIVPDPRSSAP